MDSDPHLAIALFGLAGIVYAGGRYREALRGFEEALGKLHGHAYIDYKQLGLPYKLPKCEILYNLYKRKRTCVLKR